MGEERGIYIPREEYRLIISILFYLKLLLDTYKRTGRVLSFYVEKLVELVNEYKEKYE